MRFVKLGTVDFILVFLISDNHLGEKRLFESPGFAANPFHIAVMFDRNNCIQFCIHLEHLKSPVFFVADCIQPRIA